MNKYSTNDWYSIPTPWLVFLTVTFLARSLAERHCLLGFYEILHYTAGLSIVTKYKITIIGNPWHPCTQPARGWSDPNTDIQAFLWLCIQAKKTSAEKMACKRFSLFCWLLGFMSVASCVPASSRRSPRAVDYDAKAKKILQDTPLVDGWVCSMQWVFRRDLVDISEMFSWLVGRIIPGLNNTFRLRPILIRLSLYISSMGGNSTVREYLVTLY